MWRGPQSRLLGGIKAEKPVISGATSTVKTMVLKLILAGRASVDHLYNVFLRSYFSACFTGGEYEKFWEALAEERKGGLRWVFNFTAPHVSLNFRKHAVRSDHEIEHHVAVLDGRLKESLTQNTVCERSLVNIACEHWWSHKSRRTFLFSF